MYNTKFLSVWIGYLIGLAGTQELYPNDWKHKISDWNSSITFDPYKINTARLVVKSTVNESVEYWWQSTDCRGCELLLQASIEPDGNYSTLVDTWPNTQLEIRLESKAEYICWHEILFKERGEYWMVIYYDDNTTPNPTIICDIVLANDPPNIYLPLLWLFLILFGLAVIWIILKQLVRRGLFDKCMLGRASFDLDPVGVSQIKLDMTQSETEIDVPGNGGPPVLLPIKTEDAPKARLRSLDTFRGLCLVVMIFVNYAGYSSYYFFSHATWDGLYIADLVFPWFIWIMGTSMIFSMRSMRKRKSNWDILWKICKRSFWLFALGIFMASRYGIVWETFRIPGILQRFSITYFVVALTHFALGSKELQNRSSWWSPVRDVILFWAEWLVMACVAALYLAVTFALAEPGCPKGYMGPGGLHDGGTTFNCSGGAAGYIDRQFFTSNHMYRGNVIKTIYGTKQDHDPEGILGSLTSILTCYLGLQAGKIIVTYKSTGGRIGRFITWSVITMALGLILSKGSLGDDGWIPINKNLWSISFIVLLSGMAFLLLAAMYLVIDVWEIWSGAPLFYPGMNSIVIYVCHSIFNTYFPVYWVMPDSSLHWQKLFIISWGTAVWIIVSYIMYRKKVFIAL